jgi:hypothetical protein
MMISDDRGVSELMGYMVLVAVVTIAAVGLLTGCMGTLEATENQMEFTGAAASLKSMGSIMAGSVETNNTFYTAFGMSVPPGFDLTVRNKYDDFRSIGIYQDNSSVAFLPLGSIRLESPLRSSTFEGGAVIANDSGIITLETRPAIHVVKQDNGEKALYISAISISSESFVAHSGAITLLVKCKSLKTFVIHPSPGANVSIRVETSEGQAWKSSLEECGYSAEYDDGALIITIGDSSDIYVTYAEADVKRDDR